MPYYATPQHYNNYQNYNYSNYSNYQGYNNYNNWNNKYHHQKGNGWTAQQYSNKWYPNWQAVNTRWDNNNDCWRVYMKNRQHNTYITVYVVVNNNNGYNWKNAQNGYWW